MVIGLDDRTEHGSVTRIGVDRNAEPQGVRVISAPFMPDGPGASRPGAAEAFVVL